MELSINQNRNAIAPQPKTDATPAPGYPVAYFLCDGVTDNKTLKTALSLTRLPKLRKARIAGYRHSVRSGDGASTLAFDAQNFGEWSGEEVVKGVIFEALNSEEERKLFQYTGGIGEVKAVEIEVTCPSLLGKVGKMMKMGGRIFVPEGDGDTLVGSAMSVRETEEVDTAIPNGSTTEVQEEEGHDEFDSNDFSETSSIALVDGHPAPRISPSISTFDDADVPHRTLDELPLPAVNEHSQPQSNEHIVNSNIKTTDWAVKSAVETTEVEKTDSAEVEETNQVEEPREAEDTESTNQIQEAQDAGNIEETGGAPERVEIKEMDDLGALYTSTDSDYQRFLQGSTGRGQFIGELIGTGPATALEEEAHARALARMPWAPTIPWRKENATAPVRPAQLPRTPSQFSGTTTRMRKTSDSIKSLVEHFENLSPQSTPSKDGSNKATPSKDVSSKDEISKDEISKNEISKDGASKDGASKDVPSNGTWATR